MSTKKPVRNEITCKYDGDTHFGIQEITGSRVMYQTIHYEKHSENDSQRYPKDRQKQMEVKAKMILFELVGKYYDKPK